MPYPKPDPKPYRCRHPRGERVMVGAVRQRCESCKAIRLMRGNFTWGAWKSEPPSRSTST